MPVDDVDEPPLYTRLMLLKPPELSAAEWARRAKVSSSFFQDMKKGSRPRSDNLEKVLGAIGMTPAEFYALDVPVRSEVRGAGPTGVSEVRRHFYGDKPLPQLPLYGSAVGGEYGDVDEHIELTELHLGEVLDYLARPASLGNDSDAYALTIVGDSMQPRYKPGERVAVSPKASVGIGDDVIVQLLGNGDAQDARIQMVLIKELVRRGSDYVELKQHNPPVTFRVPRSRVAHMHKVRGHYL